MSLTSVKHTTLDYSQPSQEQTLEGHSYSVLSLAVLPDGRLASGSFDKTIKLWDTIKGSCLQTLRGHSEAVWSLAVLPDGRLASGSVDKTIKLWDTIKGSCLQTLKGYGDAVSSLAVLPDGRLASGSFDKTIKLWDTIKRSCLQTLRGHSKAVLSLAVLPDGRLASGSVSRTIKLWDTIKGSCLQTLKGHSKAVLSLAVLPDGRLASGSGDHTIKLWDTIKGSCLQTLSGHSYAVWSLAVLPDGRLASGSEDKTIKLWDTIKESCLQTLEGHSYSVWSLAVLPDGRLASGSNDTTIKLWQFPIKLEQQERVPSSPSNRQEESQQQLRDQLKQKLQSHGQLVEFSSDKEIARLLEEQKSLQEALETNQKQQKTLENQISELKERGAPAQQLAVTKEELQKLMTQHSALQTAYEVKAVKRAAQEAFKADPNLWSFYRAVHIHLEEIFIGCKAVASDFIETDLTGNLNTAATGITILGKLASLIPLIGHSLDTTISVVSNVIQTIDHQRQTNVLKSISALGTVSDIEKAAESTARQLTERYRRQLEALLSLEEAQQQKSTLVDLLKKGKEEVLQEQSHSQSEKVANFGILQILGALLDGNIQPNASLEEQFLLAVTTPLSTLDHIKKTISQKLGINRLTTRENKRWCLQDFYCKPGIQTPEGKYYASKTSDPDLYGYRLGSLEEVKMLGLTEVPTSTEKLTATVLQYNAPKAAARSETMAIVTTSSKNTFLTEKSEVEELRRALKETQAKMEAMNEKQERETARKESEFRKMQLQMEKLLKSQEDVNGDSPGGNQVLVQTSSQQLSGRYTPSLGRLATEHEEMKGTVGMLAQNIALITETIGLRLDKPQEGDEATRNELFSSELAESDESLA